MRRVGQIARGDPTSWGMEPFVIREATPEDLPAMLAITNTSTSQPFTLEGLSEQTQHLRKVMPFFRQWVLEDGRGRVAGTPELFGRRQAELDVRPVVAPEAHHRGYGSALLGCALTALTEPVPSLHWSVRRSRIYAPGPSGAASRLISTASNPFST